MLQNHFNLVIFENEKKIYAAENIMCDSIEYKDNLNVIFSVENCFKTLDEETKIPKGSSKTWFEKMKRAKAGQAVSFPTSKTDSFVVSHYAGPVIYSSDCFMEKNIDILSSDILQLVTESTVVNVRRLFSEQAISEVDNLSHIGSTDKQRLLGKPVARSISWNFQKQLSNLMEMLVSTESHFIRCIKSNDGCRPFVFDSELVHRQLVYSGVFEVVKIQQSGLPFRYHFAVFYDNYFQLFPHSQKTFFLANPVEALKQMKTMPQCLQFLDGIIVGRTMIFMSSKVFRLINCLKLEVEYQTATMIQMWLKTKCLQRHFKFYKYDTGHCIFHPMQFNVLFVCIGNVYAMRVTS